MQQRPLVFLVIGTILGVATAAVAVSPTDIIAQRKTPSSKEALSLPMAEKPPAPCDAAHAGWMYFDVNMRKGGAQACICLQDNDATFQWSTFGGTTYECD